MKRSQEKPLDEIARTLKKGRTIVDPRGDSFGRAMRAACLRPGLPLSNQPIVVSALDSGCWLSEQVAYWPANEEIGRKVWDALQNEDRKHHDTDMSSKIHLIRAFMDFRKHERRLCKLLGVSDINKLGVLRYVRHDGRCARKYYVSSELLDAREFRLDVQY